MAQGAVIFATLVFAAFSVFTGDHSCVCVTFMLCTKTKMRIKHSAVIFLNNMFCLCVKNTKVSEFLYLQQGCN